MTTDSPDFQAILRHPISKKVAFVLTAVFAVVAAIGGIFGINFAGLVSDDRDEVEVSVDLPDGSADSESLDGEADPMIELEGSADNEAHDLEGSG